VASLEERLARMEATEAVRRAFARYTWFLDGGRTDDLLQVFTEDAAMEAMNYPPGTGGTLTFRGRAEIETLYRPLRAGSFRHHATNTSVEVAPDCRSARLTSYFLTASSKPTSIQGGVYEGELVPAGDDPGGEWRIARWRVSSQWGWNQGTDAPPYGNPLAAFTLWGGVPVG
jgi:hypothetical protein